jgi:acyl-CoA reductase-like NAD-dependent aldehyde dehydrogenase
MANNTMYGLAASVFTKNIDNYILLSNSLQAGMVW